MACRLPGASGPERDDADALFSADAKAGTFRGRRAGYVDGVAEFDAPFFGLSPTEAAELDHIKATFENGCSG